MNRFYPRDSISALAFVFIALAVVVGACDSSGSQGPPPEEQDVVLAEEAVVARENGLQLASRSADTLVFDASDSSLSLSTGDVVVGEEEGGYLRTVRSATRSGNQIIVQTSPATLTDVFETATIRADISGEDFQQKIRSPASTSGWRVKYLADGVTLSSAKSPKVSGGIGLDLDGVTLASSTGSTVQLTDGSVSFNPTVDFTLAISGREVDEFEIASANEFAYQTDVVVASTNDVSISKDVELSIFEKIYAKLIGPVPVVITLEVKLVGSSSISVGAGTETTTPVSFEGSTDHSLAYRGGRWIPEASQDFDVTGGEVSWNRSGGVATEIAIRPEASLKVYTVAGPYFTVGPYVGASVDLVPDPIEWRSYWGGSARLGAKAELFDFLSADFGQTITFIEAEIASGTFTRDDEEGGGDEGDGDDEGGGGELPADGLVASYSFSGDASDDTGNGFDGTVYGAELTTDRFGSANSAYEFKEADDYIDLGKASTILTGDAFSLSTWVLIDAQREGNRQVQVLSNEDYYEDYGDFTLNNVEYRFYRGNNQDSRLPFDDLLSAGEWHHIVVTHNGGAATLYLNGNEVSSSDSFPSFSASGRNLHVGPSIPDRYFPVDGKVDDVRLYERALTRDEVQQLWEADSSLP